MRSRSSRLFVLLLYLVGVSNFNLPPSSFNNEYISGLAWWNMGLVGVHPMAVLLESLDLHSFGGLDGLLRKMKGRYGVEVEGDILSEPYWFQDNTDDKCLGPAGFSECGDATLWLVRRRRRSKGRGGGRGRRTSSSSSIPGDGEAYGDASSSSSDNREENDGESNIVVKMWRFVSKGLLLGKHRRADDSDDDERDAEQWGYALQLIDVDSLSSSSTKALSGEDSMGKEESSDKQQKHRRQRRQQKTRRGNPRDEGEEDDEGECLILSPGGHTDDDEEGALDAADHTPSSSSSIWSSPLRLGPCSSDDAWTWRVDGDGILVHDADAAELAHRPLGRILEDASRMDGDMGIPQSSPLFRYKQRPSSDASRRRLRRAAAPDADLCVWRASNATSTSAVGASPCDGAAAAAAAAAATTAIVNGPVRDRDDRNGSPPSPVQQMRLDQSSVGADEKHLVRFSLVRYQSSARDAAKLPPDAVATDVVGGGGTPESSLVSNLKPYLRGSSEPSAPFSPVGGPSSETGTETSTTFEATSHDHDHVHQDHVRTTPTVSQSHAGAARPSELVKPRHQPHVMGMGPPGGHRGRSRGSNNKPLVEKLPPPFPHLKVSDLSRPRTDAFDGGRTTGSASLHTTSSRDPNAPRARLVKNTVEGTEAPSSSSHPVHKVRAGSSSSSSPLQSGSASAGDTTATTSTTSTTTHYDDSAPHRPRKIPVHPYIKESTDEIWTDPQTGLEFATDLCEYLGHQRKETGRHTLMGVGQYIRTMLKIKVYGVALYVAKRDVLADPIFVQYAFHSADELRGLKDFYSHLMHMPSKEDPNAGLFDRTLLIKLNMQLSTDTMRSSLEADWKMLTEEHKDALITSSFKARPADDNMLAKIQSDENSSRCSCGQFAPEEYNADPSCCARGTELVFTWRKNGDLEVRLDGRLMDTFPRPDLASGIFFEYLRMDDPISMDARNRFADGFPFLLAPLAQVKGAVVPQVHGVGEDHRASSSEKASSRDAKHDDGHHGGGGFGVFRAMHGAAHSAGDRANDALNWVRGHGEGVASNMANALKAAGDMATDFSAEVDRRQMMVIEKITSMRDDGLHMMLSRLPFVGKARSDDGGDGSSSSRALQWNGGRKNRPARPPEARLASSTLGNNKSHAEPLLPEPIPDEVGGFMRYPQMNFTHKLFLTWVHFYLVLLFIVSIPGSYTTRIVVKKRGLERSSFGFNNESSGSLVEIIKEKKSRFRKGLGGLEVSVQLHLESREPSRRESAAAETQHRKSEVDESRPQFGKHASLDFNEDSSPQRTAKIKKSLSYCL